MADFTYYNASGPIQINPFIFQQTYMVNTGNDFHIAEGEPNEWIILAAHYLNPNSGGSGYSNVSSHGVRATIQNKVSGRIRECFLLSMKAIVPASNAAIQNLE